jgi:hypothetical protein
MTDQNPSPSRPSRTPPSPTGDSPEPDLAETPGWATTGPRPSPGSTFAGADTPGSSASTEPSSPASTDQPKEARKPIGPGTPLEKVTQRGIGEAAEHAFAGLGTALNGIVAEPRSPYDERGPDEVWLPTEDEKKGVGKPVGRLLARRVPDVDNADDIGDLIALAIPLGLWLVRGVSDTLPRVIKRRQERARTAAARAAAEDEQ